MKLLYKGKMSAKKLHTFTATFSKKNHSSQPLYTFLDPGWLVSAGRTVSTGGGLVALYHNSATSFIHSFI